MQSFQLRIQYTLLLLSIFALTNSKVFSQEVPHSVNNTGIYEFLDELANSQIITINSAIKPYSRLFIAQRLEEAGKKSEQLSTRQQKELAFYLKDFGKELNAGKEWDRRKDLFYYSDDLFSLTVNPILGGEIFKYSSEKATYWRNGIEARGYIDNWGFYASLRDNHEKPILGLPQYLTKREGGHIKEGTDWSEMQGGVTYAWKWGSAGLVKDRIQWGNNYNGANIFGGNNPTFVQFRLNIKPVKWFEFNYFHGRLTSMVVDSARSYYVTNSYGTDYREVYHKKFISANMFTITPFKNFSISAGNSIVYSDIDFHPVYLIPIFFYKSVDHSVNQGINNMNSQMFFDLSTRQIRNLHLYGTMFIDELSVDRFTRDDEWNFFSYKAGFRLSNFPVKNLSLTTEYTYSYPLTFQHNVPTLTFATNNFGLGHYLKDNSREFYLALDYRPLRTLNINLSFTDAIRGPDYTSLGTNRVGNPPLETVEWHNTTYAFKASYQIINDLYTWVTFTNSNITGNQQWSPAYFYGNKNTFNVGMTLGF